jgi:hypothetical protein
MNVADCPTSKRLLPPADAKLLLLIVLQLDTHDGLHHSVRGFRIINYGEILEK